MKLQETLIYCAAVVLVLVFRAGCLGAFSLRPKLSWQLVSGLWLGFAAWTVGAIVQAWVPLWQTLLLGVVLAASLALLPARISGQARTAADFLAVAALGVLSVIPVRTANVLAAAVVFALTGLALDRLIRPLRPRFQGTLLAVPGIMLLLLGVSVRQVKDFGSRLWVRDRLFPLRLALVVPNPGTPVHLESGTVMWILRTRGEHPRGTAILLHGNDWRGSRQPAALALQGALLRAGYDVFSVDQAGYGASPPPANRGDWRAWDPTIVAQQALDYARSGNNARAPAIIVVGHSMGANEAVQWLSKGAALEAAYLFGGSNDLPTGPESTWIRAFHQHRRMPCCMPVEEMSLIRDHFHGGAVGFARELPPVHPVVHFIRFGIEYEDVSRDREPLYAAISPPKRVCDFAGVTHYFNTLSLLRSRLVLIDTLAVTRTAGIFSGVQQAELACAGESSGVQTATASSP